MAPERLTDVTLPQYAAVLAALAEGHEVARVLAHEGIDPTCWPEAEEAWSDRLAEAVGTDEGLQAAFDEHLADAQERYGRRLPPLDTDLRAFLDFRRRWSIDADPRALLERLGLRVVEVARLSRVWSERIASNPALAAEEQAILREEPGELPSVAPIAVELPPTPAEPEPKHAERDDEPTEVDEIPPFAPLAGWERQGAENRTREDGPAPAVGPVPKVAKPSYLKTGAFSVPVPRPLAPRSAAPASPPERGRLQAPAATAELGVLSLGPALPFIESARADSLPQDAAADANAGRTAPMPAVMPDARLPFAAAGPSEAPAAAPATKAPPTRTGTSTYQGIPLAAVLPFTRTDGGDEPSRSAEPGTVELEPTTVVPLVGEAPTAAVVAPKDAPPPAAGKLRLDQYAAFCAELEVFPDGAAETFARYGLASAREGVKLASGWQARFREHPAEFEEWQRLHRAFVERFRAHGRQEVPS